MRDHVRFASTAFSPAAAADPGQVHTERYGYTLATWVAARLQERGFDADSPTPEAWGWLLGVAQHGRVIRIGCGNVEGSVSKWVIWLDVVRPGKLARLLGRSRDVAPNAAYGIIAAIHGALQSSGHAGEIEWFRVGPKGEEMDHAATPI